MSNLEDIAFNLHGLDLHGLAAGSVENDIVLCLHGWLDNAASFVPLIPFMDNYRVIAIDWPGHGLSSHRSDDAHYHFVDWVYDLVQLFDANGWKNIHIVGHSMGGMIASAFAAAFPEYVRSLTLIDSIGFINAKAEQTTKQLRSGMLSRLKGAAKTKNKHVSAQSAVNARLSVSDFSNKEATLLVERGLAKDGEHYIWRSDHRLRTTSPYRLTQAQAEQFIRDIKVPVQLIYGSKGMDMVSKGLPLFSPLFSSFESHELVGGHHVHMEKPQETADILRCFIKKTTQC